MYMVLSLAWHRGIKVAMISKALGSINVFLDALNCSAHQDKVYGDSTQA